MEEMESTDLMTPRREAIELIKVLCASSNGNNIKKALFGGVNQLINEYNQNKQQNWRQQLLATDLMIGLSVLGQTKALGVTRITPGIPLEQFFQTHIFVELQGAQNPLVLARCIRFLNMFRIHLPSNTILNATVNLAQRCLNQHGEVISSYTAVLVSNLAIQKTRQGQVFIDGRLLEQNFGVFLNALKTAFNNESQWEADMHRIKALMNLCQRCQNVIGNHVPDLINLLKARAAVGNKSAQPRVHVLSLRDLRTCHSLYLPQIQRAREGT